MATSNPPAPPYPLVPGPVKRSWLDRQGGWKIPLGCLVALLLICAFVAILLTVVESSFRKSIVYQEALARAGQSPEVINRIGEPLRPGLVLQGQLNVSGSSGSAKMEIPISGPRGKATILLDARKLYGAWMFNTLEVHFEGKSEVVNLLKSAPGLGR
jgi:hypothetical protein